MSVFVKNAAVQFLLFMFFQFNFVYVKHKLRMLLCRVIERLGISIHWSVNIYTIFISGHHKFPILMFVLFHCTIMLQKDTINK